MFAERPTIQLMSGGRLHLQHGPIDVVLKAWVAADRQLSLLASPPRNDHGHCLRSPLSWGEGQGEVVRPIDNPSPLTPTLSPWERVLSVVSPRHSFIPNAEGDDAPIADLARVYEATAARFQTILGDLVAELSELRKSMHDNPQVSSPVARRMAAACAPFAGTFITPMAAVAGAVADELLAAMLAAAPLAKAFVNDGGDIAIHIAPDESMAIGIAGDLGDGAIPAMSGRISLTARDGVGGIATSGRGGRSFSLGIADRVTVLARNAALADAAATLIANAVNIDSPAIRRAPAVSLDPDSDLGARLVTVDVGPLSAAEVAAALASGQRRAEAFHRAGTIAACALTLQGKTLIVGGSALRSLSQG